MWVVRHPVLRSRHVKERHIVPIGENFANLAFLCTSISSDMPSSDEEPSSDGWSSGCEVPPDRAGGCDSGQPSVPSAVPSVTKRCKPCGTVLPLDRFYKDKRRPDGHEGTCKKCRLHRIRQRHETSSQSAQEPGAHSIPLCGLLALRALPSAIVCNRLQSSASVWQSGLQSI